MPNRRTITAILVTLTAVLAGGCNEADVASRNLSKDADNFKVVRRVVFFNGITDEYLLSVEGLCSITADTADSQLEVTCKTGDDAYKKHFLWLSDNVSYFVEQLESKGVSVDRYKVVFRPSTILPDIDVN